jgi:DNA modification methylase
VGARIIVADVMAGLAQLADESVHCVVTSPPYWGLRDYGVPGQIGLEATPEEYVAKMVDVFREVRRVLREDGTLWLNLGDSYGGPAGNNRSGFGRPKDGGGEKIFTGRDAAPGTRAKDLVGIPWRVALALQADGWWLRQDVIWHKPNPMPESVTDRCTKAHEYLFMMTKAARYWYDADAIAESATYAGKTVTLGEKSLSRGQATGANVKASGNALEASVTVKDTRNARSVWTIATQPYKAAHFATFPEELPARCIKAGCPADGTVLDPFGGAGTTGLVATMLQRHAILIELNPEYAKLAEDRIYDRAPLFAEME